MKHPLADLGSVLAALTAVMQQNADLQTQQHRQTMSAFQQQTDLLQRLYDGGVGGRISSFSSPGGASSSVTSPAGPGSASSVASPPAPPAAAAKGKNAGSKSVDLLVNLWLKGFKPDAASTKTLLADACFRQLMFKVQAEGAPVFNPPPEEVKGLPDFAGIYCGALD